MKTKSVVASIVLVVSLLLNVVAIAKSDKPYKNGSVWEVSFIRVLPGNYELYMTYLSKDWKTVQDALKKEGIVLSYKILSTEGHTAMDWNLMLMVEYKDMASMEANEAKSEEIVAKVVGDMEQMAKSTTARGAMRELTGNRIAREVVLQSK